MKTVISFFTFMAFFCAQAHAVGEGKTSEGSGELISRIINSICPKNPVNLSQILARSPLVNRPSTSGPNKREESKKTSETSSNLLDLAPTPDFDLDVLRKLNAQNQRVLEEIESKKKSVDILEQVKAEQALSLKLDQKRNELQKRFLDLEKEIKALNRQRKELYENSKLSRSHSSSLVQDSASKPPKRKIQKATPTHDGLKKMIFHASCEESRDSKEHHPNEMEVISRFLKGLCEVFQKTSHENTPSASEQGAQ